MAGVDISVDPTVATTGEAGISLGNAAKTTSGSIRPRAVVTDNKDKILNERYQGCLRPPSPRGISVALAEDRTPLAGIGRELSSWNKSDCMVPFIEAYKGNVLDEVKMNDVATAQDMCQIEFGRIVY